MEFTPQRGLKQEDTLAGFVFNIVVECLTGLMREAQKKNLYDGFKVGRNNLEINILQYADDTVFFGTTSMENVRAIKVMLRSFELVSGLKINFAKSNFGAIGMFEQWLNSVASYLNSRALSIHFPYLGIPIGANPRRNEIWGDPIVKKCESKLSKWKQNISFGVRVYLIKSVLNSIPIYFFSFLRAPKKVVDRLVRLQRWFLWGEHSNQKIAWVNWGSVCLPKEKGGLSIKDLVKFNFALLGLKIRRVEKFGCNKKD